MISRRSEARSAAEPACSRAMLRVRWSNTSSDRGRNVMQRRHPIGAGNAFGQMLEESHDVIGREAHEAPGQRHAGDIRLRMRRGGQGGAQLVEQLRGIGGSRVQRGAHTQSRPRPA